MRDKLIHQWHITPSKKKWAVLTVTISLILDLLLLKIFGFNRFGITAVIIIGIMIWIFRYLLMRNKTNDKKESRWVAYPVFGFFYTTLTFFGPFVQIIYKSFIQTILG